MPPINTSHKNNEKYIIILFCSTLIICFLIYLQGIHGVFTLDDESNINLTKIEKLNIENLKQVVASNQSGVHPLTRAIPTVSFSISHVLDGSAISGFKYHNILLHLLCGLFVFLFIYKLHQSLSNNINHSRLIALLCSIFWLLHPLHVSTTLYSVQRITQFSALFTAISLCIFLYARASENQYKKIILYYIGFPLTFLLIAMSKETVALICFYILSVNFIIRKSQYWKTNTIDKSFVFVFGWMVLFLGMILFFLKSSTFLNYSNRDFTLEERLLSQAHIVTSYISNLIYPRLSEMGLFLDDTEIQKSLDILTSIKACFLIIAFLISCLWAYRGKFIGIISIFFFGHFLESTILPLELAFEHRNYFPSVGILAFFSYLIVNLENSKISLLLSIVIILSLTVLLNTRVNFWSNEDEWQKTSIAFHPKSVRANIGYKNYLDRYFGPEKGKLHIQKSKELIPNEVIFPIIELLYLCAEKHKDYQKESTILIDEIDSLLEFKALTAMNLNALLNLSQAISINQCSNINIPHLYNFIHNLIITRERENKSIGNLYAVRGVLLHAAGRHLDATDNFKLAYFTTRKVGYIVSAIKALLSTKETYPEAVKLVELVNKGEFFNINHYETIHLRLNKLVKESPFNVDNSK